MYRGSYSGKKYVQITVKWQAQKAGLSYSEMVESYNGATN
jgi:hypothetical protein